MLWAHLPLALRAQHSHRNGAKPGLIDVAVMEGAVVGLTRPSSRHQGSRRITERIPWLALLEGSSTCLGDPAHAEGKSCEGGDAAERPCCSDTQTGVKDGEEEPCLLLCPCCNLNHSSKHSAPCTAHSTILQDVEVCRRREGSRASE